MLCRCKLFKNLLWDLFKQSIPVPVKKQATTVAQAQAASALPLAAAAAAATPNSPKTGKPGSPHSKAGNGAGSKRGSQSESGVPVQAAAGAVVAPAGSSNNTDGEEAGGVAEVCCIDAVLLYICADRDLYQGITKAIAAVTASAAVGTVVDAPAVVRMCYPHLSPEQAAPIQRAPLSASQITAAVAAASAETNPAGAGGATVAPAASHSSSGAASAVNPQAAMPLAAVKPSQLMYGAACERVVTLLLQRYQWKDIYIAARL